MTLEWLAKLVFVIFIAGSFLPEIFRDLVFLSQNHWDFSKQRQSNIFNGLLKFEANRTTIKQRFFFVYSAVLVLLTVFIANMI